MTTYKLYTRICVYSRHFIPTTRVVDPTLLVRDVNRTEYDTVMQIAVQLLSTYFTEVGVEGDVEEALKWMYAPWPVVDNGEENKKSLGQVVLC